MFVETKEVNDISIITVAQDYGLRLVKYKDGMFRTICPNPSHGDKHLGNCYVTDLTTGGRRKNYVKCFSCGALYTNIDLVMVINHCRFEDAKENLIERYSLRPAEPAGKSNIISKSKWKGLSYEEYSKFGLHNVTMTCETFEGTTAKPIARVLLRNLALENPDVHDEMLLGKFNEKMDLLNLALELCITKHLKDHSSDVQAIYEYEKSHLILEEEYKKLLWKGLMNKAYYAQIYESGYDFAYDLARDKGAAILRKCLEKRDKSVENMSVAQ